MGSCSSSKGVQVHPTASSPVAAARGNSAPPGGGGAAALEFTALVPAQPARPAASSSSSSAAAAASSPPAFTSPLGDPAIAQAAPAVPAPRKPKKTLLKAVKEGNLAAMEELLQGGANIEALGMWDNTPLLAACAHGQSEAALLLIKHGANVVAQNEHGATSMHYAAVEGCLEVVEALIASRRAAVDPEWQEKAVKSLVDCPEAKVYNRHLDAYGKRTPLCSAAESGFEKVISCLLASGASVESRSEEDGQTPLWLACRHARLPEVKVLLQHGAQVDSKDSKGVSVLGAATQSLDESVVLAVLAHGVKDVNDTKGMPLRDAVKGKRRSIAEALITHGAAVTPPKGAEASSSPLHVACDNGDEYLVSLLIRARSDPSLGDAAGLTAFDLLRRRGLPDGHIVSLLSPPNNTGNDGSTGATGDQLRQRTPSPIGPQKAGGGQRSPSTPTSPVRPTGDAISQAKVVQGAEEVAAGEPVSQE